MFAALGSSEPGQGGVLQQRVLVQQVLPSRQQQLSRKLSRILEGVASTTSTNLHTLCPTELVPVQTTTRSIPYARHGFAA